jgi:archaellum component FlaC
LVTKQFRSEIDKLNKRILGKVVKETSKLEQSINSLRKEAQQQIQSVSERVEK